MIPTKIHSQLTVQCHRGEYFFPATVTRVDLRCIRLRVKERLIKGERLLLGIPGAGPGFISCTVLAWRKGREEAFLQVAASKDELRQTWLVPILQALEYVEALRLGSWNGQAPLSGLLGEDDPGDALPILLADAREKLKRTTCAAGVGGERLSVVERRLLGRLKCHFEIMLQGEQESFSAVAVDLSPAGIGIETSRSLRRGTVVALQAPSGLEFLDTSEVRAQVRYSKKQPGKIRIGLSLEDGDLLNTWLAEALRFLGFSRHHVGQKRRFVRARPHQHLPVEICGWRGDSVMGQVLDIGRGGVFFQSPRPWHLEEPIRLAIGPLGQLPVLYISGMVIHQQHRPDSGDWLVRVRFLEVDAAQMQVDKYVLTLLRALNPPAP